MRSTAVNQAGQARTRVSSASRQSSRGARHASLRNQRRAFRRATYLRSRNRSAPASSASICQSARRRARASRSPATARTGAARAAPPPSRAPLRSSPEARRLSRRQPRNQQALSAHAHRHQHVAGHASAVLGAVRLVLESCTARGRAPRAPCPRPWSWRATRSQRRPLLTTGAFGTQLQRRQTAPAARRRTTGGQLAVAAERTGGQLWGPPALLDEQQSQVIRLDHSVLLPINYLSNIYEYSRG